MSLDINSIKLESEGLNEESDTILDPLAVGESKTNDVDKDLSESKTNEDEKVNEIDTLISIQRQISVEEPVDDSLLKAILSSKKPVKHFPPFRTSYVHDRQISCISLAAYSGLTWLISGCTNGNIFFQEIDNFRLVGPSYELVGIFMSDSTSGSSGKTTNINNLHEKVDTKRHSDRITTMVHFIWMEDLYLVTGSMDQTVRVWKLPQKAAFYSVNLIQCKVVFLGLKLSVSAFTCVAIHMLAGVRPIIATTGRDNRLRLWDFTNPHEDYYCPVLDYASGELIARMSHEDWITGVIMYAPEVYNKSSHASITVPPLVIVTCGMDRTVRVWTVVIGEKASNPTERSFSMRNYFRSESQFVSVGGQTVKPFIPYNPNSSEDELQHEASDDWTYCIVGRHHTVGVFCITYHERQDTLLISGDHAGVILLWSVNATEKKLNEEKHEEESEKEYIQLVPLRKLEGHKEGITGLMMIPRHHGMNSMLVSGSNDKTLKIWNLEAGDLIRTLEGHKSSVGSVVIIPPELSSSSDLFSGFFEPELERLFQPVLCSAELNGSQLFVWNFLSDEEMQSNMIFSRLEGHLKAITSCKFFSKHGSTYLVSASKDKSVRVFDVGGSHLHLLQDSDGKDSETMTTHADEVTAVEVYLSADENNYCITASADKFIKIWRIGPRNSRCVNKLSMRSGVTCLAILQSESESGDSVPYVVAGCVDRSLCIYNLNNLISKVQESSMRPQRGHDDSVFQVVTLGRNIPKKEALIVSSSISGEIIVWRWSPSDHFLLHSNVRLNGKDGKIFLTVCEPTEGLPYIAFVGDESNFVRTWNPWSVSDIDSKMKVLDRNADLTETIDHFKIKSLRFRSKITAISSFTPTMDFTKSEIENAPVILVGHDDGSTSRFNCITKWTDKNNDEEGAECVDDGDRSNDVLCLSAVNFELGSIIAVGLGNSVMQIIDSVKKPIIIEARDALIHNFIGFNLFHRSTTEHVTHIIAACNDKCVRIVTLSGTNEGNDYDFLHKEESKLLDCVFPRTTDAVGYFVTASAEEHFGIYEIERTDKKCHSKRLCTAGVADAPALTCLRFYDYGSVTNTETEETIKTKDASWLPSWLPFIITADREGICAWKWRKSETDHLVENCAQFATIDFYGDEIPKPKVPEELPKGSSGSKKLVEITSCPVFCLDVCAKYNFIAVGSLLGYPLLLDSLVTCNKIDSEPTMNLTEKDRQFKPDKGSDGSCHKDSITCICICVRKIENDRTAIEIVTGSKDKSIIMWDYARRKKIWGPISASTESAVRTISVFDPVAKGFSSSGTPVIVVTSGDNTVRIYNYKGESLRELDMHQKPVLSAEIVLMKGSCPVLVTTSMDSSIKYTDAYFILANTFPTHSSVKVAFNRDRRDFKQKKNHDKKWHRMHSMCKLAGGGRNLFTENAKLFMISMVDRDEFNFMEAFLGSCSFAILIPQEYDLIKVCDSSYAIMSSEVQELTRSERKKLEDSMRKKLIRNLQTALKQLQEDADGCFSMLFVAMFLNNKDDVEDIVSAILKLVNKPLKDLYDQFYPVGARLIKNDLVKLASKFPLEFLRLIKDTKMQKAQLVSKDRITRHLKRGAHELRGITFNCDLEKMWELASNQVDLSSVASALQYTSLDFPMFFVGYWMLLVWAANRKIQDFYQLIRKIFYDEDAEVAQWVTPMVLMIPELATFDMLNAYISVCKILDDVSIFDSDVGRCALNYSWRNFGRRNHFVEFGKHLTYCLIFSLSLFLFERLTSGYHQHSSVLLQSRFGFAWLLQGLSIIGAFYFLIGEHEQFRVEYKKSIIMYMKDMWNVNDLALHLSFLAGTLLRCAYTKETNASRNVLSVCAIFMYFKILYYLRAYKLTGPLVAMIFQIVQDIIPFCLVLFIVLFGFSHSFWIISLQNVSLNFGTFQNALLNSFDYMLGGFDSDYSGTTSPALGAFLYVCFMLIVALLLLNLLIALMGDSFANVRARGKAQWRMEATSIISDQVQWMPTMKDPVKQRELTKYYPKIIHALVLTSDLERESSTEQQITDIAEKLSSLETKLEGKLDRITKAMADADIFELSDDDDDLSEDDEQDVKESRPAENDSFDDDYYDSDSSSIADFYADEEIDEENLEEHYAAVDVSTHDHTLLFSAVSNGWGCDGRYKYGGCVKGCTGFYQTRGWIRYTCAACDFDYCQGCADKYAKRFYLINGEVKEHANEVGTELDDKKPMPQIVLGIDVKDEKDKVQDDSDEMIAGPMPDY